MPWRAARRGFDVEELGRLACFRRLLIGLPRPGSGRSVKSGRAVFCHPVPIDTRHGALAGEPATRRWVEQSRPSTRHHQWTGFIPCASSPASSTKAALPPWRELMLSPAVVTRLVPTCKSPSARAESTARRGGSRRSTAGNRGGRVRAGPKRCAHRQGARHGRKRLRRYIERLKALQAQQLTRDQLLMKLGAAVEERINGELERISG